MKPTTGPVLSQNRIYSYQALISLAMLLLVYHSIVRTYGFSDDYLMLWSVREGFYIFDHCVQFGRVLYGFFLKIALTSAYFVENLKYLRLIGMAGVWVASIVLFRFLVWLRWNKANALLISLCFFLTPSFALYIGWSCMFPFSWAFVMSFAAGAILVRFFDRGESGEFAWVVVQSLVLMGCSLFTYQPSAMGFLIPVFLYILVNPRMPARPLLIILGLFVLSCIGYFLLFKLTFVFFDLPKPGRTNLDPGMFKKFFAFYFYELKEIAGQNFIFFGDSVKSGARIIGLGVVCIFFLKKIVETVQRKTTLLNLGFVLAILPMTNIPRIASSESWVCFRSLGMTCVCFIIIVCFMIETIRHKLIRTGIITVFFTAMALSCYYNINERFILLNVAEYSLIENKVKGLLETGAEQAVVVRPHWNSHTSEAYADEYSIPSTMYAWIPLPVINLIVEKETGSIDLVTHPKSGTVSNRIKLMVVGPGDTWEEDGSPVINIRKLLESRRRAQH